MKKLDWRPILELFAAASAAFLLHFLYFQNLPEQTRNDFYYSIPELYAYFFGFSAVILLLLLRMKKTNLDSVGNTFLLLTCIKMVLAYLLLRPVLERSDFEGHSERISFFIVFAVFLAIETTISIRMLNRK